MAKGAKRGGKKRSPARSKKTSSTGGHRRKKSKSKSVVETKKRRKPAPSVPGIRKKPSKGSRAVRKSDQKRVRKNVPAKPVRRRTGGKSRKPAPKDVRKDTRLKKKKPAAKKKRPVAPPPKKRKKPPVKKKPKKKKPARRPPPPPPPPPPRKPRPKPLQPPRPSKPLSQNILAADAATQDYLGALMDIMSSAAPELELSIKSFINADGSVDGELRIGNLPEEWLSLEGLPSLKEFLSLALKQVGTLEPENEGGKYWISVVVRFGPQNDSDIGDLAELYKRHRGLFQVGTFALQMDIAAGLQNAVVSMGEIAKNLITKRGLPPSVIVIRVTWLPVSDVRPHRYEGEKGGGY